MTGFRIGYACGPHEYIEAMMKIHQYTMLCAPILAQEAAICALEKGKLDMEDMRSVYRQRRDYIVKRFNDIGLPCVMPDGAFYVYPDISSTGMTSPDFARKLLQEERVAIVPGTAFSSDGDRYIRCVYAASMDEIETALDRIEKFVDRRRR
jgi:aminotransferase